MTVADRIAELRARAAELRKRGDFGSIASAEWHESQANREEWQERRRVEKLDEAAEILKEKLKTLLPSPATAEAVQPAGQAEQEPVIGRPKGTGLAAKDAPLVAKMRELLSSHKAKSNREAARMVVCEAEGFGTDLAKEIRLAGRLGREKKRKSRARKSGK